MAVNVKLGVDIGEFKSGIQSGQQILKGLNAEMKASEATFKATGNAEQKLASQTKTLNSTIQVQKGIADQARQALEKMTQAGVNPADAAYQKLYATMMNAEAGANEAQAALNVLGTSAGAAADGADKLSSGLSNISKKLSLDQVINGIEKITSGLENAAKKAVQLGEAVWENIMDSARLSDDILTQAGILDMTPEQYQRYKGVFNTIGEVTISEWAATKRKIEKAMVDPSSEQIDIFKALGFKEVRSQGYGQFEEVLKIADNWEDVFWQVGSELQKRVESGEMSSAMADVYGEALFGKKYSSMKNLIRMGQDGFEQALNEQNTISDEALQKNAELNDTVIKLQESFDALKAEVTSALAPALTEAAKALDGVLGKILEYVKSEDGQEMLGKLGDAISGLFGDLSKIDPEQVVSGFVDVFTKVTGGIQWLVDNAETAKGILATVVGAWGALTLGESVLKVIKLVDGIKGLTAAEASAAGASAGASWASAFASAAMKAAPFLAFMYTMLKPSGSANDQLDSMYANGQVTEAGWEHWSNNRAAWTTRVMAVGTRFGDLGSIMNNEQALNIIGNLELDNDAMLQKLQDEVGLVPIDTEPVVPENAAEEIANQVGTVFIPAELVPTGRIRTPDGWVYPDGEHANGIWSVPYNGYLARLHKGERVVPAREVASRSFSSNLYVENMNMSGGLSADALAAAIAGRNQRMMAGYGS